MDLAQKLSALVIFAEMRFFGASLPFGANDSFIADPTHLGLLSIENTLADYASLLSSIKAERNASTSPVIAVGGSLAGSLAFWFRVKYPSLVTLALASSAPILGYPSLTSPYGWYRVATDTYTKQSPGCVEMVREAFSTLQAESCAKCLSKAFDTCEPIPQSELGRAKSEIISRVTGSLAANAESSYPLSTSPVVSACSKIEAAGGGSSSAAFAPILTTPGNCLDLLPSSSSKPLLPRRRSAGGSSMMLHRGRSSSSVRYPRSGKEALHDAWFYLACTEIIHPIAANNVTDMFPPQSWSIAGLTSECNELFDVTPRPAWMPTLMGMSGGAKGLHKVTSHVIFTNGLLDPWSSQSVLSNASSTLIAINIPDGSHHSDLGAGSNPYPMKSDSSALKAARAQQLSLIRKWLHLEQPRPSAPAKTKQPPAATPSPPRSPDFFAAPAPSPMSPPSVFHNQVIERVFIVCVGVVGVMLLFLGQRAFKVFLALLAFGIFGGGAGYLFLYHVHSVPVWAEILIACGVGAAAAVLAYIFNLVGLILFAGFGGLVLTALPLRLVAPGIPPAVRVACVCLGATAGMMLTALFAYKFRNPDEEDADGPLRTTTLARMKLRAEMNRKLLEATVTSVIGTYAIVIMANQWYWDGENQCTSCLQLPALLNIHERMPECGTPCLVLVCGGGGVLLLGCIFQTIGICRGSKSRADEARARNLMVEPLMNDRGPNAQPNSLANRMRHKYCGGRAATETAMGGAASSSSAGPPAPPPPTLGGRRSRSPPPRGPPATAAGAVNSSTPDWAASIAASSSPAPPAQTQQAASDGGAWAALVAASQGSGGGER